MSATMMTKKKTRQNETKQKPQTPHFQSQLYAIIKFWARDKWPSESVMWIVIIGCSCIEIKPFLAIHEYYQRNIFFCDSINNKQFAITTQKKRTHKAR